MSDDRVSQPEQTLAAAVGLQTAAINALVSEMRLQRQSRVPSVQDVWRTVVAAVVAIVVFVGLESAK